MKKSIILAIVAVVFSWNLSAQNYAVVNSEKIFKSIDQYNQAITQLDQMANDYQKQVDAKFEEVEKIYNAYMARRAQLSEASQQANEENLLKLEKQAQEFQESIFGTDGELMKNDYRHLAERYDALLLGACRPHRRDYCHIEIETQ